MKTFSTVAVLFSGIFLISLSGCGNSEPKSEDPVKIEEKVQQQRDLHKMENTPPKR